MRQTRISAVLLLLLVGGMWLASQPMQTPQTASTSGQPLVVQGQGLVASVEQEGHMTLLRLRGHRDGAQPTVTVTEGSHDLSAYLRYREEKGTETVIRLSYAGVNHFPARVLTYTWEVDGERVTGEHMYVHPNFPFKWQRERKGPFVFYHTGTLTDDLTIQWTGLYADLAEFFGLEPVERVVYVLPDIDALQKALGSDVKERRVAGLWIETLDAVLLSTDYPSAVLRKIMNHELAHAFLANRNPSWWEEGIATWTEGQMGRRHGAWDGDRTYPAQFAALQKVMQEESPFLVRANPNQKPPLDPYTVGFSFVLYVEDRFGEEAVRRLAVAASEQPVAQAAMLTLGEDLDTLERGWQEFVKRGEMLKAVGPE